MKVARGIVLQVIQMLCSEKSNSVYKTVKVEDPLPSTNDVHIYYPNQSNRFNLINPEDIEHRGTVSESVISLTEKWLASAASLSMNLPTNIGRLGWGRSEFWLFTITTTDDTPINTFLDESGGGKEQKQSDMEVEKRAQILN
ncbi:unnamed protein product [Dovyalis caffra]|uniref:Uncharacterized protein n=1 Tax=Dovyalis caffra TaxID=77055 RepID=A0AAV1SKT4_9ROSI|nr:unnamed protein product [Dovyalis caffra]